MSTVLALLAQQPLAFWLAVTGLLAAGALAWGNRAGLATALASALGAVVAAVDPAAGWAQAVGAGIGAAGVVAATRLRRRAAPAASPPPEPAGPGAVALDDEARLLGRTARTRAAFVGGEGEVEIDGAGRPARTLAPDEAVDGDVLVRIVRVGAGALVVRPVSPAAS